MSLLSIRRDRRDDQRGPHRPASLAKLLVGAAIVAFLLWYLNQYG
jgi:hypothetical protein